MRITIIALLSALLIMGGCNRKSKDTASEETTMRIDALPAAVDTLSAAADTIPVEAEPVVSVRDSVVIEKELLYNKHTLEDTYAYKDGERRFQWDKIRRGLERIDSVQSVPGRYGYVQNRKNANGEALPARNWRRDEYGRVADSLGVERYQGVPLYLPGDTVMPERYAHDGSLVKFIPDARDSTLLEVVYFDGKWSVPSRYVKMIPDTVVFTKVIFVDRTNQNITALEKDGSKWMIRSMNPATTGVHRPPYQHETPLGLFVIQEKKAKMYFYKDGTKEIGGYAPYASRFTNGGYIHGVPVNYPRQETIEYSRTLGTTPRSHMCVRNATSHAKFIYDWAAIREGLVFVIE